MKNYLLLLSALLLSSTLFSQGNINGVVINEVLLDPSASSTPSGCTGSAADNSFDIDGNNSFEDNDEFIELYNITTIDVNIGGWTLADDDGNSFTFPANTFIAGQSYIVVTGNWTGSTQPANVFTANLGLNNGGETIFLTDGNTCIVVRVGGSDRNDNDSPPTGCIFPYDADEDWGRDQDGSAVGRNPDGSAMIAMGTCGTATPNMVNSPLPVELTRFTGKIIGNRVELKWTTASELENSHFEIERSENGKMFKQIGKVKGSGNTLETQYYDFVDVTPLQNLSYYRLKQVDFNGTSTHSEIIALAAKDNHKEFEIYPNPSPGGIVQLDYATDQNGSLQLQIIGLDGQILLHQFFIVERGQQSLQLDLNSLAKGMYFVNLQQGKDVHRQKIVVQ
ncbi:MAG: lamin tail domain-containing protein [Bacteroidota bacterium]